MMTNGEVLRELEVYFRLLWLFVTIISGLVLLLLYLYLAVRRARKGEMQSQAFSHLVMAAQEEERRRISCELHDTVLPEIRQQKIVSARIREICTLLMPPDFSRLSLKDSLAGLCSSFSERAKIPCVVSIEKELDFTGLDPLKQLHLYRIVQEALTNIEKHSAAGRAVLVVRALAGVRDSGPAALVCVSDDGAGFKPQTGGSSGLGMRTMRERAAALGARLDFISESGNGLMVRLEIPL
jgi:signal transduction histidine kinase